MKLSVVLEPSDDGGFTVVVPSLPGCISEGNTREEAVANIREAIELYLEPVDDESEFSGERGTHRSRGLSKVPVLNYERVLRALRRDEMDFLVEEFDACPELGQDKFA